MVAQMELVLARNVMTSVSSVIRHSTAGKPRYNSINMQLLLIMIHEDVWGCVYKNTDKRPIQTQTNFPDRKASFQFYPDRFCDNSLNYLFVLHLECTDWSKYMNVLNLPAGGRLLLYKRMKMCGV